MMNLKVKFEELLILLVGFVADQISCSELQRFSLEVIDYFTDTPSKELPAEEPFEKVFWYTIWQIQHLCDDLHQRDGTTKRELSKALAYMKGEKNIPQEYVGRRP